MKKLVGAALVGAVLCTVCDHLHATNGVLSYSAVFAWSQAWWVPLLFFAASLGAIVGVAAVRKLAGGKPIARPGPARLLSDVVAFVTAYAFTAYGHTLPNVVLAVLVLWWVARMLALAELDAPAARWVVVFSLVTAVVGAGFEGTWSALGFFHYHHPDMIGVPRWLPGIYLHVAPLAITFATLIGRA
ncbi:MAG: hypothetical protein JWM74_5629 [Myxococcaceae bacterium]|nr:hypothetical protein [Myxococcaceae bacterium]